MPPKWNRCPVRAEAAGIGTGRLRRFWQGGAGWTCFSGFLCTQIAQLPETQAEREGERKAEPVLERCICRYILNMQIREGKGRWETSKCPLPGAQCRVEGGLEGGQVEGELREVQEETTGPQVSLTPSWPYPCSQSHLCRTDWFLPNGQRRLDRLEQLPSTSILSAYYASQAFPGLRDSTGRKLPLRDLSNLGQDIWLT